MDCLVVYSLLQAGMSVRDPRLDPRHDEAKWMIDGMKRYDMHGGVQTYSRGIRATALALYNRPEDHDVLKADAHWLICVCDGGAYTYTYPDPPRIVPPSILHLKAAPAGIADEVSNMLDSSPRSGTDRDGASTQPDYSKPKDEPKQDPGGLIVRNMTYNVDPRGEWDNSNSQYGVLGVWSAAEVGIEVPRSYWFAVDRHWSGWQELDGHWPYTKNCDTLPVTGASPISMTCAGLATTMVTYE